MVERPSSEATGVLLEAARTYPAKKHEPEMALAYPLLAAFLLTGGRAKEVLGLRLQDVSTDRRTVTFRPNEFHEGQRLKTKGSARTVPLWPQLAEILTPLLDQRAIEGGRLLFRSPHVKDREVALTDLRDLLDRVAVRAGWADGGDPDATVLGHLRNGSPPDARPRGASLTVDG
jgi:integrase